MNIQIEKEDVERKMSALSTILNTMNVPEMRKDLTQLSNVRWLSRNLKIQNGDHPLIDSAIEIVSFLFRKHFLLSKN